MRTPRRSSSWEQTPGSTAGANIKPNVPLFLIHGLRVDCKYSSGACLPHLRVPADYKATCVRTECKQSPVRYYALYSIRSPTRTFRFPK